jgi:hypothetical protein
MKKIVLLPCKTKHKIIRYLNRTFGDKNYVIFRLSDISITNYSSKETAIVADKILKKLDLFIKEYGELKVKPDIYVMLVGGIYHNVIVVKKLLEANLQYDFLIFERKVGRYVIVDSRDYYVRRWFNDKNKRKNGKSYSK